MPKPKRNMTPVERIIVVAILGILMSIILPNLQRTSRRARGVHQRRPAPVVSRQHRTEPAGRLNTIEVNETANRTMRSSPDRLVRLAGIVLRLVILGGVILIIAVALKQGLRRAQQ